MDRQTGGQDSGIDVVFRTGFAHILEILEFFP